ncbi:hypothetical protein QR680_003824 [Steinernema hermaphroditum]|uniref:VWFA domain-containing protein n=1 Tax=Steinernema hermaphroditum TaxID=289476 RepID=A0AA39LSM8_9BILA|nr:hypothetical protein QR680_003824 [Steinernema hermaphroditum]
MVGPLLVLLLGAVFASVQGDAAGNAFQNVYEQLVHVDTTRGPQTPTPTPFPVTPTSCQSCTPTAVPVPSPRGEGQCACSFNKLWLDIVVLMDRSKAMGSEVRAAAAGLNTLFKGINLDSKANQSSRIAFLTYSRDVTTVGDFGRYSSVGQLFRDMLSVKPDAKEVTVDLANALLEAQRIFAKNIDRPNVQRAVIVVAAEYKFGGASDPKKVSSELRESGISIITLAHRSATGGQLAKSLALIASENMNFENKEANVTRKMAKALCYVNCFCKPNWLAYKAPFKSGASYGECLYHIEGQADRPSAQEVCPLIATNGHLVHIKTTTKHERLLSIVKGTGDRFHIGWKREGAGQLWKWDGEQAQQQQPLPTGLWKESAAGNCGVGIESSGVLSYENRDCEKGEYGYVCQAPICDTDNYCSAEEVAVFL